MSSQWPPLVIGALLGLIGVWAVLAVFGILGSLASVVLAALLAVAAWRLSWPGRAAMIGAAGVALTVLALLPYGTCPGGILSSACEYPDVRPALVLGVLLITAGAVASRLSGIPLDR